MSNLTRLALPLAGDAASFCLFLRDVAQQDVTQRDQSLELLAVRNWQMAEAELTHEEEAVVDGFVDADRLGVGGHDLGNFGGSRAASQRYHAIHYVTLGKNADNFSVAQHRQSADAMFHHETGGLEHGAVGVNGIDPAIFHDIVNLSHKSPRGSGFQRDRLIRVSASRDF